MFERSLFELDSIHLEGERYFIGQWDEYGEYMTEDYAFKGWRRCPVLHAYLLRTYGDRFEDGKRVADIGTSDLLNVMAAINAGAFSADPVGKAEFLHEFATVLAWLNESDAGVRRFVVIRLSW